MSRCKPDAPTTTQLVAHAKQNVQLDDQIIARPAVALRTKQGDGAMSSAVRRQGVPKRLQALREPVDHPPGRVRRGRDGVPRPRLERGHRLVAHPGRASHSRPQGRHGRREVRQAPDDLHGRRAAGQPAVAAGARWPRRRSPSRATTVDFTIRFDNVGNQPIGNVAILDSLNTRLEFVPDSAQCSVDAKFSTRAERGRFGGRALRAVASARCSARAASSASAAACGNAGGLVSERGFLTAGQAASRQLLTDVGGISYNCHTMNHVIAYQLLASELRAYRELPFTAPSSARRRAISSERARRRWCGL